LAHQSGGLGVGSSNLPAPTISISIDTASSSIRVPTRLDISRDTRRSPARARICPNATIRWSLVVRWCCNRSDEAVPHAQVDKLDVGADTKPRFDFVMVVRHGLRAEI